MSKKFGTSGWNFAGHMVEKRVKLTQMSTPSAASTFLFFFRRSRQCRFQKVFRGGNEKGQGPQCCFGRLRIVLKVGFAYSSSLLYRTGSYFVAGYIVLVFVEFS